VTALVTGGAGFVGSAVVRAQLARGERVRVLVRPTTDLRNLTALDVELAYGDLREPATLRAALAGCSTLFHVAADYRLWAPRPEELYASNVEGTRALMEAALELSIRRIVCTSSVATLGLHPDGRPADEDTPVGLADMIGPYKRSKYLAEELVRELVRTRGLPAVIVNPSAPVGPGDLKPTPTGRMVLDAAAGRMPAYVDTGLNIVHVDDVATGHLLACEHGRVGERYILGGTDLSLREILENIAEIVGRTAPRWRLPVAGVLPLAYLAEGWARVAGGEPRLTIDGVRLARKHMYFTSARAERELGYSARPAPVALMDAVTGFRAAGML
jgi:dihydroflavonol-4-reductase